jgi:tagatose-1,6-bisphosphate aldolase non-catalytic subunit AgaZ/GatZ
MQALKGQTLPVTFLRQHLPALTRFADAPLDPEAVLMTAVDAVLNTDHPACHPSQPPTN